MTAQTEVHATVWLFPTIYYCIAQDSFYCNLRITSNKNNVLLYINYVIYLINKQQFPLSKMPEPLNGVTEASPG